MQTGKRDDRGRLDVRSYLNNPDPVGDDPQKAVGNIFGEGVFSLATSTKDSVTGTFDMGGGLVLDLRAARFPPEPEGW
jgi:hypothetical protein